MEITATGKNVEIAIQNGLLECGLRREDVDVKVVDAGGLFKKAKVILVEKGKEKANDPIAPPPQNAGMPSQDEDAAPQTKEDAKLEQKEKIRETKPNKAARAAADTSTDTDGATPVGEKKKKILDTTRLEARGKEFLLGLAKMLDPNATCEVKAGENEITFLLQGENLSKLIGFHGDNLRAVQMILSGLKQRQEGSIRLYVDIDGYKENRNQAIIDLANRTAEHAVKIERNIHLDPMNAYERRIVHTTLSERTDVTTESTGVGEKRHVVIKPTILK